MFLSNVITLVAILTSTGWAQTAQCGSDFDWNKNSLDQDPCVVGSNLDASCRGGVYTYPSIGSGQSYPSPQADDPSAMKCDCNTVMYSLSMACSSCQGGQIYSWTQWRQECGIVYIARLPFDIPLGTAVPHWAYANITSLPDMNYNDTAAKNIGRDPEEFRNGVNTASTGMSTTTRISTDVPSPTNTNDAGGGTGAGPAVDAIVGVLAVTVAVFLAILVLLWLRHRRWKQAQHHASTVTVAAPRRRSLRQLPLVASVRLTGGLSVQHTVPRN